MEKEVAVALRRDGIRRRPRPKTRPGSGLDEHGDGVVGQEVTITPNTPALTAEARLPTKVATPPTEEAVLQVNRLPRRVGPRARAGLQARNKPRLKPKAKASGVPLIG